jgi:hypothetical protein
MRHLEYREGGRFTFTTFDDNAIPRYAILSHTWGADVDEVTFADLTKGGGKHKPGYKKIRFCGEQAQRDGLQYFWVDTCCIDKTDKAELPLAIQSMFRWYQNATKCYVYLSDVSLTRPSVSRSNVHPRVTGHPAWRDATDTSQHNKTQQWARGMQTLGIAVLNYQVYSLLVSFRNRFCLQCNLTIYHDRYATALLWLAVGALKAYALSQKSVNIQLIISLSYPEHCA